MLAVYGALLGSRLWSALSIPGKIAEPSQAETRPLRRLATRRGYRVLQGSAVPGWQIGEHRAVAQALLGRRLSRDEAIHHRNEDPSDNRPANLVLMTRGGHTSFHKLRAVTPAVRRLLGPAEMRPRPITRFTEGRAGATPGILWGPFYLFDAAAALAQLEAIALPSSWAPLLGGAA